MMLNKKGLVIGIICLTFGLLLSIQFMSLKKNEEYAFLKKQTQDNLVLMLLKEQQNGDKLSESLKLLKGEIIKLKDNSFEKQKAILYEEIEHLKIINCLNKVRGKGILVKVKSLKSYNFDENPISSILNELKASDAQAISVNNIRIAAGTSIKFLENEVFIDKKIIYEPYIINAIVDSDNAENALNIMGGPIEKIRLFTEVRIEKIEDLTIPALINK